MGNFVPRPHYGEAIKQIKNSFGKIINFDEIIHLTNRQNLNEVLDQLTSSIPHYIFYGGFEQIKEVNNHLENMKKNLGESYSINGHQFITEIFDMDDKINKFFKDNYFEFEIKNNKIDKYSYYKTKIFLLIAALINSIICSKLIVILLATK